MKIERIIIKNYKIYESLDFSVQNVNNVFVGNNGSGKTTLLESIYLALTGRLDNQNIDNLLTPDMFANKVRRHYIDQLKKAEPAKLPKIIIEVYFKDEDDYAPLKGSENSQETDCPGIRFECSFDSQFADEYKSRLEVKQNNTDDFKVLDIPIEYYCVKRTYFSGQPVIQRTNPFKVFLLTEHVRVMQIILVNISIPLLEAYYQKKNHHRSGLFTKTSDRTSNNIVFSKNSIRITKKICIWQGKTLHLLFVKVCRMIGCKKLQLVLINFRLIILDLAFKK